MAKCTVCKRRTSPFFMHAKPVCLRCDELLFDIEIECDEHLKKKESKVQKSTQAQATVEVTFH